VIKFWVGIASETETKAKVVKILKQYNADTFKAEHPFSDGNSIGFVQLAYQCCLTVLI
jgi:hypothetical protein